MVPKGIIKPFQYWRQEEYLTIISAAGLAKEFVRFTFGKLLFSNAFVFIFWMINLLSSLFVSLLGNTVQNQDYLVSFVPFRRLGLVGTKIYEPIFPQETMDAITLFMDECESLVLIFYPDGRKLQDKPCTICFPRYSSM